MRIKYLVVFSSIISIFSSVAVFAKEYKCAVKQVPATEFYINILKTIVAATGNTVTIQVVPPTRADRLISDKEIDIQLPIIVIPDVTKQKELKYDYSTTVLAKLAWVLYTNKAKPIDVNSLRKGNPDKYKIEIDPSRTDDYTFPVSLSSNFEASLKRLSEGSIDGVLISQLTGDPLLKKAVYKNISRQLWSEYDLCFSIQKGAKGGEADKMLSDGINRLKAKGTYEELMGEYIRSAKYDNWQP
jgi:hypothetical protein